MSGLQKFSLAFLSITTAAVFLFLGWLAFGDEISTRLASYGAETASEGGDVTIWAVGDSLMVAATGELEAVSPGIIIDAEVGRRMDQGIDVLATMLEEGTPNVLIVALGTNNGVADHQIDTVMDLASGVDEVVFVNVSVPRPWESDTNATIDSAIDAYPNATLVEWKAESRGNSGLFRADGFHLSQAGTQLWVGLIMAEAAR